MQIGTWLIPAHCDVTPAEREAVLEGAWKRWAQGGVKLWLLGLTFCIVILGTNSLLYWIGQRFGPFGSWYRDLSAAVSMLASGVVFGAIAFFGYRPGIYAELRALGYDVCPACGFDLSELPSDESACPSCRRGIPPLDPAGPSEPPSGA